MFKVNNRNTTTGFEICSFGTYFTSCYSVSIVNFEQVNAGWVNTFRLLKKCLIYIQFTPIYSKCSISITTENIQKFSVFRGYLIASGGIIGEGISRTKTKGSKESSRDGKYPKHITMVYKNKCYILNNFKRFCIPELSHFQDRKGS